jgi:hypothetical protein
MNQQQIYAKKQKALERKIVKMKAEQEQLQTEQRQYEQASKIADSHILRLKDYVITDIKAEYVSGKSETLGGNFSDNLQLCGKP